jgi:hypothetical protein
MRTEELAAEEHKGTGIVSSPSCPAPLPSVNSVLKLIVRDVSSKI